MHPPVLPRDDEPTAPRQVTSDPKPPPPTGVKEGPGTGPEIVVPRADARYPFSEPAYPSLGNPAGHEGTVLLALQILAERARRRRAHRTLERLPKLDAVRGA